MPVRLAISFVPSSVSASASASRTLNARCTAPTSLKAGCPVRGIDSVAGDCIADKAPVSTISDLSSAAHRENAHRKRQCDPTRDDDALPVEALPGEPGQIAAEGAGEVVEAVVERGRGAAIDVARLRDSDLRGGDPTPVGERDERKAEHEGGKPRRQCEGQAGGCDGECAEREAPPADPVGERAEDGAEDTEQPEREDGAAGGGPGREGRPLQTVDDVRERADEREEERASGRRRLEQSTVAQLAPDTAMATPAGARERQGDERPPHHHGGDERPDREPPERPRPPQTPAA